MRPIRHTSSAAVTLLLVVITCSTVRAQSPPAAAIAAPTIVAGESTNEWCSPEVASEGRWLFRPDDFGYRAHSLVHDPARDRLVAYGGSTFYNRGTQSGLPLSSLTWVRPANLSAPWRPLVTAGPTPPTRAFHVAVFDPSGDRMIVYGGWASIQRGRGDAWQLDFTTDPPTWSEIAAVGPRPRMNHTAIFDPVGRRMLVYGGVAWTGSDYDYTNEIWELSLDGTPTWTRRNAPGSGLPRCEGARSAYDSLRRRWIISGGIGRGPAYSDTDWFNGAVAIDLATMAPTALPEVPREPFGHYEHTLSYDPGNDRLILFGGADDFATDALALPLDDPSPEWRTLPGAGLKPETRVEHVEWFDARRNRLLVLGGGHTGDALRGTHVLGFGRRVDATLLATGGAPFNPRAHRPVTVVLRGSAGLDVTDVDPASIRIGTAGLLDRGPAGSAFEVRDHDGDGQLDVVVRVDGAAIGATTPVDVVDVSARSIVGDGLCGTLDLGRPADPGRTIDAPATAIASAEGDAPAVAGPGIELAAIAGGASRDGVRLRARILAAGRHALELWSVTGRLVASSPLEGPLDREVALRPGSRLAPGIYWARIAGAATTRSLRLVLID